MTRRTAALLAAFLVVAIGAARPSSAQDLTALARIDPARSTVVDRPDGADVALTLSQPVPWRVHTLADPPRLVLDFRQVAFDLLGETALGDSDRVTGLRHGLFQPGWSRLVLDLAGPYAVERAGMATGAPDGTARIEISLVETDPETFAARAGAPLSRAFPEPERRLPAAPRARDDGRIVVALDPGHGGIDPGAVRDGVHEADLMLTFARDLRERLVREGGYEVILTREEDVFVSLEERISIARRAGADLLLSLHADAIAEGIARGAQVYTLAEDASSRASALLAERHDRGDLLAGIDLSGQDDGVAQVLMSIARTETTPRTEALAESLVAGLRAVGVRLHRRARERANFSVLKSPDIPSVLLEVGFMSSPGELEKLQSPEWRAQAAEGIAAGLAAWRETEAVRAALIRR